MIGFLKGIYLKSNKNGRLIIFTGKDAGVGYDVLVPQREEYINITPNHTVSLYIHTHVREDALDLFGFLTPEEKELFETLITVSGIGPRAAIGVMSKISSPELIRCILDKDKARLLALPGIGKKTVERIVLELVDVVKKKVSEGLLGEESLQPRTNKSSTSMGHLGQSILYQDAKAALIGLGYREQQIMPVLQKIMENEKETPNTEGLIRQALQRINTI